MNLNSRKVLLIGLGVVAIATAAFFIFITTHAQATSSENMADSAKHKLEWAVVESELLLASNPEMSLNKSSSAEVPPPVKDSCLHCHITGENTNLWTPLTRWSLFGMAGLVFAFGIYRSTSVWLTRKPWKSFTMRTVEWVDERYEVSEPLSQVLSKPVPKYATRWWYCLGGITAFLFVVQGITGIMLAFYYNPSPEGAYASIQFIETQVRFGASIRMIHHWAANAMVVMCFAHMARVFIMGAYKPPRELNWVSGALLLFLTMAFGFTGYLLPWDQRAFWATTVGSEIGGSFPVVGDLILVFLRVGWDVGALTLSRFYSLHIIVVPLLTVTLMGVHFLMIRRQGVARPL